MSYNLGHVVGPAGKGISSITKTGTSGLVDTYTILFSDGTSTTFDVTNGSSGADIVTSWEDTLSDSKVPSEKLTKDTIDGKASTTHSHGNISSDGKIGSTSGKPVITGTGGAVTTGAFGTSSGQFAEGNHTHSGYVSATKVTSWSGTVSDSNVPSEKLVKDSLDGKQASLVSGTNIKTINNNSLLGSGNITISGGSNVGTFTELQSLITNASSGDVIVLDKDYKNSGNESGISIEVPLTIIGNGHILDADGKCQIFNITEDANGCNISGLIFINGSTTQYYGGALKCKKQNIISNCVFINNSASHGGAIYSSSSIIVDCYFNNNSAVGSSNNGYGGAIDSGSATILNCNFVDNSSNGEGGAISASSSSISITNCRFAGNTATTGANVSNYGYNSLTIYNCHVSTGLNNIVNKDDLNSEVKVTSWSSTVSNDNIPSEKLVKDTIDNLIGDINDYITG